MGMARAAALALACIAIAGAAAVEGSPATFEFVGAAPAPVPAAALSNASSITVSLEFAGKTQEQFEARFLRGTRAAIANSSGVGMNYVTYMGPDGTGRPQQGRSSPSSSGGGAATASKLVNSMPPSSGSSAKPNASARTGINSRPASATAHMATVTAKEVLLAGGARRLQQAQQHTAAGQQQQPGSPQAAHAVFAIKTNSSEPWAQAWKVRRRILASAAFFGRQFNGNLAKNGVPLQPAVWLEGQQILGGSQEGKWDTPVARWRSSGQLPVGKGTHGAGGAVRYFAPGELRAQAANASAASATAVAAHAPSGAAPTGSSLSEGPQPLGLPLAVFVPLVVLGGLVALLAAVGGALLAAKACGRCRSSDPRGPLLASAGACSSSSSSGGSSERGSSSGGSSERGSGDSECGSERGRFVVSEVDPAGVYSRSTAVGPQQQQPGRSYSH